MAKKKRNPANKELTNYIFDNYEIKTALDIHEALKYMFAGTLDTMLEAELDDHLGYDTSANNEADITNHKSDHTSKKIQNELVESEINVPRDREGSFVPLLFLRGTKMSLALRKRFSPCVQKVILKGIFRLLFMTSMASKSAMKLYQKTLIRSFH